MSERPRTITAEFEAEIRSKAPAWTWPTKEVLAELDAERAAHKRERELSDQLAAALEVMPYGIAGWPQDVSKRTLGMREAALAQHAAYRAQAQSD